MKLYGIMGCRLGINRGFLSVLDTAFVLQAYFHQGHILPELIDEMTKLRSYLFDIQSKLSGHVKDRILTDEQSHTYTIDPETRYKQYQPPRITEGQTGATNKHVVVSLAISHHTRLRSAQASKSHIITSPGLGFSKWWTRS